MDPVMNPSSLTQFYDDLKSRLVKDEHPVSPNPATSPVMMKVTRAPGGLDQSPGALAWRNEAAKQSECLVDGCRKHLLLDIYCKILPLDKEYVAGNMGQCQHDIDGMLASKGMTATQYLTSCYEATKAPLLEFILRSTKNIGRTYMEKADEKLKDAQENDVQLPEPETPNIDSDEDVQSQLVDVKKDMEYETFVDELKKKTIQKIVDDVSTIINDKKEEEDMTFDTEPAPGGAAPSMESAFSIAMDYLHKELWGVMESTGKKVEKGAVQEELIGMAIREATLNQLDVCFRQPEGVLREYASRIRFGHGAVVNKSAVASIMESAFGTGGDQYDETGKEIADSLREGDKKQEEDRQKAIGALKNTVYQGQEDGKK